MTYYTYTEQELREAAEDTGFIQRKTKIPGYVKLLILCLFILFISVLLRI